MAKVLYASSFGTDDPTRATLPFLMASGAIDAGHEPEIALMAQASYLAKDGMVEEVSGFRAPIAQRDHPQTRRARSPRLHLRAVREGPWGLRGKTHPKDFADLTVAADQVVSYLRPVTPRGG